MRLWRSSTGDYAIEAKFAGFAVGTVYLRKLDGRVIKVPLEKFNQDDKAVIEEIRRRVGKER
jgi:hypothetical protein